MSEEKLIHISTRRADGGQIDIQAECRHYKKNGTDHLLFEADGDKCRISFDEKSLTYRRQGELTYDLYLESGKQTEIDMITAYGRSGMICITDEYRVSEEEGAIIINIKYNMADEDCEMDIRIEERS